MDVPVVRGGEDHCSWRACTWGRSLFRSAKGQMYRVITAAHGGVFTERIALIMIFLSAAAFIRFGGGGRNKNKVKVGGEKQRPKTC